MRISSLIMKRFLFSVYVFVCAYMSTSASPVCGFAVSQTSTLYSLCVGLSTYVCVCNCRVGGGGGGGDLVCVGHGSLVEIKPP